SPIIAEVISTSARATTVAQAAPVTGTAVFKDGSAVLGSVLSTSSQSRFSTVGGVKNLAASALTIHREEENGAPTLVTTNVDNFFAALRPTSQRSSRITLAKTPTPSTEDWLTVLFR